MNVIVISYSLTGNNNALAIRIASELSAKHVEIRESKPRNKTTIILDVLLNRTPRIEPIFEEVGADDVVIFIGPVWMGHVATPFRSYFKQSRGIIGEYAFVSISGGANGPNPNLANELSNQLGKAPAAVIDLHIADLLSHVFKTKKTDTSSYRVSENDINSLSDTVVKGLRFAIPKLERALVNT